MRDQDKTKEQHINELGELHRVSMDLHSQGEPPPMWHRGSVLKAEGGGILLCKDTAERVSGHFTLTRLGKFKLKNVSEEVEIFTV